MPAGIMSQRFRNVHHRRFWRQQLAVAWDQHLIAELEGPSSISRTVRFAVWTGVTRDTRPIRDMLFGGLLTRRMAAMKICSEISSLPIGLVHHVLRATFFLPQFQLQNGREGKIDLALW
jgi:hypothetical protein